MIKNISSVGIVLMTMLVVYRASTLNDTFNLDGHYQREADASFSVENSNRLHTLALGSSSAVLLAVNGKTPSLLFHTKDSKKIHSENFKQEKHDLLTEISEEPVSFTVLNKAESTLISSLKMDVFSFDRDSRINPNLSLLFPRQRILQYPQPNDFTK